MAEQQICENMNQITFVEVFVGKGQTIILCGNTSKKDSISHQNTQEKYFKY